jgi:hypothetical protein
MEETRIDNGLFVILRDFCVGDGAVQGVSCFLGGRNAYEENSGIE